MGETVDLALAHARMDALLAGRGLGTRSYLVNVNAWNYRLGGLSIRFMLYVSLPREYGAYARSEGRTLDEALTQLEAQLVEHGVPVVTSGS